MRVTIMAVSASGQIRFDTRYGQGLGRWQGEPPKPGKTYVVEFDLEFAEGRIPPGGIEVLKDIQRPSISIDRGATVFVARLESIDDLGVASIRLGNHLMMLETTRKLEPLPSWVRIGPVRPTLYDTNI